MIKNKNKIKFTGKNISKILKLIFENLPDTDDFDIVKINNDISSGIYLNFHDTYFGECCISNTEKSLYKGDIFLYDEILNKFFINYNSKGEEI